MLNWKSCTMLMAVVVLTLTGCPAKQEAPAPEPAPEPAPVETEAAPATAVAHLVPRADLPDAHVYDIARTMFDHLPLLQSLHPALESVTLKAALDGLPAPLHPGAVRLYRERGVEIPERLLPA